MIPTDSGEDLPVWDEGSALASVGGNRALALSLLTGLCASLPDELRLLRERHADCDLSGTADRAHHISGGAAYCGVHALQSRLKRLEARARAGDTTGARNALSEVEREAERLMTFAHGLT